MLKVTVGFIFVLFHSLTEGLENGRIPRFTWNQVDSMLPGIWAPARALIVRRRFQWCINYTARPPADSNCRGCVSCNEVLNNEGSVCNLEEKWGMVGPKNVVLCDFFAHLLSSVIKQYFRFVIHSDEHCKGSNGIKN